MNGKEAKTGKDFEKNANANIRAFKLNETEKMNRNILILDSCLQEKALDLHFIFTLAVRFSRRTFFSHLKTSISILNSYNIVDLGAEATGQGGNSPTKGNSNKDPNATHTNSYFAPSLGKSKMNSTTSIHTPFHIPAYNSLLLKKETEYYNIPREKDEYYDEEANKIFNVLLANNIYITKIMNKYLQVELKIVK